MKKTVIAMALATAAAGAQAENMFGGPSREFSDHIHTRVTANGWLTKVETEMKLKDAHQYVVPDYNIGKLNNLDLTPKGASFSDTQFLLENTNGIFLGGFHVSKGRFAIGGDLTWLSLNFSGDDVYDGPIPLSTCLGDENLQGECEVVELGLGGEVNAYEVDYDVIELITHIGFRVTPELEVYAGARWMRSHVNVKLEAGAGINAFVIKDVQVNEKPPIYADVDLCVVENALCNNGLLQRDVDLLVVENDWVDPMIGVLYEADVNDIVYLNAEANLAGLVNMSYAFELQGHVGIRMDSMLEGLSTELGYRMYQYMVNDDDIRQRQKERGFQARLAYEF